MSTNPTINFGPSMLTFSLLFIVLNRKVSLFNCFKEPWVELKSLKTGCILSIIDKLRIDFYFAIVREEIVSINLLRKEYSILHVLLLTLISILHF